MDSAGPGSTRCGSSLVTRVASDREEGSPPAARNDGSEAGRRCETAAGGGRRREGSRKGSWGRQAFSEFRRAEADGAAGCAVTSGEP